MSTGGQLVPNANHRIVLHAINLDTLRSAYAAIIKTKQDAAHEIPQSVQITLTWPKAQQRIQALLKCGLQRESEFEKAWPAALGTLLGET